MPVWMVCRHFGRRAFCTGVRLESGSTRAGQQTRFDPIIYPSKWIANEWGDPPMIKSSEPLGCL